jgi:hypothetical protein
MPCKGSMIPISPRPHISCYQVGFEPTLTILTVHPEVGRSRTYTSNNLILVLPPRVELEPKVLQTFVQSTTPEKDKLVATAGFEPSDTSGFNRVLYRTELHGHVLPSLSYNKADSWQIHFITVKGYPSTTGSCGSFLAPPQRIELCLKVLETLIRPATGGIKRLRV